MDLLPLFPTLSRSARWRELCGAPAATRLEPAVKALIGRVLQRRWGGQDLDIRSLRYVVRASVDEAPTWVHAGRVIPRTGTRITPELLAAKGLL
jgi:hypothetical protein